MYSIYDYIHNEVIFVNNIVRRWHKELTSLIICSATSCQSRYRHCSIWKKPTENLSLVDISRVMNGKCVTKSTIVGLEGGEFILYPEVDNMLEWFGTSHPSYTLLSNYLVANKVISAVRNHHPKHLYMSPDGNIEAYRYMRERDGYDRVVKIVETCKNIIPISLMFYLPPWNSFEDMRHIIDCAKQYNTDIRIGIYGTVSFFGTTKNLIESNGANSISQVPSSIHQTYESFDFAALYDEWGNKRLKLRCRNMSSGLVIHSNGDVLLCQNLDVILGNIHENALGEISNSGNTCRIQYQYSKECN